MFVTIKQRNFKIKEASISTMKASTYLPYLIFKCPFLNNFTNLF